MRTLFHNAQFWSAGVDIFDGVLVEDEIIVAIGTLALESTCDESIDLNGAFVIPAIGASTTGGSM